MSSSTRFRGPVTDADEKEMRSKAIPGKTKATTDWGMKDWTDWAVARQISPADVDSRVLLTTPLLNMPTDDLAYWLWMGKFVLDIRKQNGSE